MQIWITSHAMTSHVRPLLPVADAARRAGHDVTVAVPAAAEPLARRQGFATATVGDDWLAQLTGEDGRSAVVPLAELEDGARTVAQQMAGGPAGRTAADLLALAERKAPDLIVRASTEFGGALAAEVLGVPHVSVSTGGATALTYGPDRLAASLAPHREALGLAPDPDGLASYRYRHASFLPPGYDRAEESLPNTRCYRHVDPLTAGESLPAWLEQRRSGRPLVFASLGTLAPHVTGYGPALVRMLVTALDGLEVDAIVSTAGVLPAGVAPGRPHVVLVDTISQPLLLARCDVFVTHAGQNSVREALGAGVPMVAMPIMGDQLYNAARCVDVGVAATAPAPEATIARLRREIRRVLSEPAYRERADTVRRQMAALPSVDDLVAEFPALTGVR